MENKLIDCEKTLEVVTLGVKEAKGCVTYTSPITLSKEKKCYDCLDLRRCQFAERVVKVIERKDTLIFKRK